MILRRKKKSDVSAAGSERKLTAALWVMSSCILIELALQAGDLGLIGSSLWRGLAYQNGAFWPGLLRGWEANYAAQPVLMFVTYAFLHAGFWHLAGNMLALLILGRIVIDRVGQLHFVLIYGISILGGAVAFGALPFSSRPMVGASAALFGLAAAWQYWDLSGPKPQRPRPWHLAAGVVFLVATTVVLRLVFDWPLAWQAHLGGALSGLAISWLLRRRGGSRRTCPQDR